MTLGPDDLARVALKVLAELPERFSETPEREAVVMSGALAAVSGVAISRVLERIDGSLKTMAEVLGPGLAAIAESGGTQNLDQYRAVMEAVNRSTADILEKTAALRGIGRPNVEKRGESDG